MLSFDILEVAISTYLQLYRSSIVTNDNALFVHLQGTDLSHLHDRAFYCMIQRTSFVMTVYDNHHLSCTEHSTHATVNDVLGTLFTSLSKKRELAIIVSVVNVF